MAQTVDTSNVIPNAPTTGNGRGQVPFRVATYERSQVLQGDAPVPGAAQQILQQTIVGDGFMYAIIDDVLAPQAAGAATAFAEDMTPNNAALFLRMQLADPSGDLINLSGFENYVNNIQNGQFAVFLPDRAAVSALFVQTAGAGAGGGTFNFLIRYTVSTGHRDLVGAVGNQSRTVKYILTETINPSAAIWTTAPIPITAANIARTYLNYAVPNPVSANGSPQDTLPSMFNVIHRVTSGQLQVPAAGLITHTMNAVGNTIRSIALVLRYGAGATPRAAVEAAGAPPTQLVLKAGSATIFQESWRVRKEKNFRQFGFDMPAGVVIFDFIHDLGAKSGDEEGVDWLHTQNLSDLHFEITHGAAAVAGSSLVAITDELLNVA